MSEQPPLTFVDADGHLLEPPTALVDYAPAEYKDTIWQVHADADGVEWLTLEDMRMEAAVMALAAAGGFDEETRERSHRGDLTYAYRHAKVSARAFAAARLGRFPSA